jgi:cell wall-associated NlpC family hydrolase
MPARRSDQPNFRARRIALGAALLALCAAAALALTTRAPAQDATADLGAKLDELESNIDRQSAIQGSLDEQNARINDLIAEESELRRQADAVQAELDSKQAELDEATAALEAEKQHLAEVRARLERAIASLEQLLIDIYKSEDPDMLGVVMQANSWEDLVTDSEYLERVQNYDEAVVERVTSLREEIELAVQTLRDTQERIKLARDEIAARRAELQKAQDQIAARHAELAIAQQARKAELDALQAREGQLEEEIGTSVPGPGERAMLVDGEAVAPADAPLVVKAVIDAANQINDKPYIWGGGHGSFEDEGYDCSGAVSYALHGGGLLSSPLDSGGLTSWGESGGGNWITVYANYGHVYMVVAGLRFDTSMTGGNGPRWSETMRSPSGFVARHPSGF